MRHLKHKKGLEVEKRGAPAGATGVGRGGESENEQVGSGQVKPWMPGLACFWIPCGGR